MTERVCGEHEVLIGYLYDELPPADRRVFERHLAQCDLCRDALEGFGRVREGLGVWMPPNLPLTVDVDAAAGPRAATPFDAPAAGADLRDAVASSTPWMPWARAAAIVLMAGAGMAAANLHVTISRGSVTLSTGWLTPPSAASGAASLPMSSTVVPPVAASATAGADWRTALTQLEASLRDELAAMRTSAPAPGAERIRATAPGDVSLERVRALITESEQRQQRELALRLTQFGRDVDQQRRTDLVRINQGFGQFEGRTGAEIARQRQMIDYIMRVSAPPPQQ
ncbi:MAG: hypothetical protein FJW29_10770 [Acidobacteria bacterium]|nr:hypothetical protein [Acidobacteriota bacterium]